MLSAHSMLLFEARGNFCYLACDSDTLLRLRVRWQRLGSCTLTIHTFDRARGTLESRALPIGAVHLCRSPLRQRSLLLHLRCLNYMPLLTLK